MRGNRAGRAGRAAVAIRAFACLMAGAVAMTSAGVSAAFAAGFESPQAHATEIGEAPASEPLQLVLPLITDEAGLRSLALAVTTSGSPQYGQYESIRELARRFGASAGTRRRVVDYLRRVGASDVRIDATALFVDATISAAVAERLFSTRLARFRVARDVRFTAPTGKVRVPAALRGLIGGVIGLDTRPVFAPPQPTYPPRRPGVSAWAAQASSAAPHTGTAQGCAAGVATDAFTPNQYLTAYDYDPLHRAGMTGQGERVALIEIDGFKYSDILSFARCFGLHVPALHTFRVGVSRPLPPGFEATLDLELVDTAAPDLKAIDVYEGDASLVDSYREYAAPLQNPGLKPQLISISSGACEADWSAAVGPLVIDGIEATFEMAAASGITYLAASGDAGSASCLDPSGNPIDRLAVDYPASSSWVTGVGGTNLQLTAANQIVQQVVWNDASLRPGYAGGGGQSDLFKRPRYQDGTVAANVRAVPDVSMLADLAPHYAIYCSAKQPPECDPANPWTTLGGTSAATPLLAGGFALVDQALRAHQRQDLGLANPLLYRLGRSAVRANVFYDVTAIGNDVGPYIPGNLKPLGCCTAGVGYDEASGWGSVDLAHFDLAAILVQPKIVSVAVALTGHQSPVARHEILMTVTCSGPCSMSASAQVRIGHSRPFVVQSNVNRLRSKGSKTITIPFSAKQLSRLRAALLEHERITATVFGVILDAGGSVERRTGAKQLTISS